MVNTIETVVEMDYAAYVYLEDGCGFVSVEYGQGESLVFLVEDIEDATFFRKKRYVLEELKGQGINYIRIDYYIKKTTITTEIEKEINEMN